MCNSISRMLALRIVAVIAAAVLGSIGATSRAAQGPSRNYIVNGDFENAMTGWSWHLSNADAASQIITSDSHSGQACLRITNQTHFGPNVYGSLSQLVTGLTPDTKYELSAWVKCTNASDCWMGGGPGWMLRHSFPSDTTGWHRLSLKFKTGPAETTWQLIINTDGPTDQLLLDDVAVVDASTAPVWLYAPSIHAGRVDTVGGSISVDTGAYVPNSFDITETITGTISISAQVSHPTARLTLGLRGSSGTIQALARTSLPDCPAESHLTVAFSLPASLLTVGSNDLAAFLDNSNAPIATRPILRTDLSQLLAGDLQMDTTRLQSTEALASAKGMSGNAYVRLGLSVAKRYVERLQAANISTKQSATWSYLQLKEIREVLDDTDALITSSPGDCVLKFGKPRIDNGVLSVNGAPAFFGGYNGWQDVVADIPNFGGLGASVIQQESGPNTLAPDGTSNLNGISHTFAFAQQHGVMIDFLLSPHYFPKWAVAKAPDVAIDYDGFIKYNIDHPVAREVIQKWIQKAATTLGAEPALLSFCLSNEPVYTFSGRDPYSRPLWTKYLQRVHRAVGALNALYGTTYDSFDEVPVPPSSVPKLSKPIGALRAYFDWLNFNDENFANWHRWMNGLVKASAPAAHTDIKILGSEMFNRDAMNEGVDPEQFCSTTDLGGNDDVMSPPGVARHGEYACDWQTEEMGYDLLRSFHHQPVINTENHLIPDRDARAVPMSYARAVMWQGALHGQGATAVWVWGEAADEKSDLYGSIYFRPADVFGAGRAWLDAQRLAGQVASIIRAKPHVALLFSRTSLFWQPGYRECIQSAYTALDFLGEPVTFVTEKELADGNVPDVAAIVIPQATHVSDATCRGVQDFAKHGGRLVFVGSDNLAKDQYDRGRSDVSELKGSQLSWPSDDRKMQTQMEPVLKSIRSYNPIVDMQTGRQAFGIEYRVVEVSGKLYVSAVNMSNTSLAIDVPALGAGRVKDLLSGENLNASRIEMPPMQPRMLRAL